MKHKHYDMIVAKATNTKLTTFIKFDDTWIPKASRENEVIILFDSDFDYFLCHPKHENECLHWLNGGDVQIKNPINPNEYDDLAPFKDRPYWDGSRWFMRDDKASRIKPKKEKYWIIAVWSGNKEKLTCYPDIFNTEREAREHYREEPHGIQFIQVELEV